jgi:cell division septation protein DedD
MSDIGRDGYGAEEDRLPWLEPVEEEPIEEGVSVGRLIAGLMIALIALGLVVGGVYWLKQRAGGPGTAPNDPTLIAAQPGPVKVKPAEPGGMAVKGQGDSSYAASEGADPKAQIDLSAVPEAPVTKPAAAPAAAPAPAPAAKPAPTPVAAKPAAPVQVAAKALAPVGKPAPAPAPAAAPVTGGAQIQLGAFSSEAKANEAWKSLSGRFTVLAPLAKSVAAVQSNGKTVYRLRASAGGQASSVCAKLKVAGETCLVIG